MAHEVGQLKEENLMLKRQIEAKKKAKKVEVKIIDLKNFPDGQIKMSFLKAKKRLQKNAKTSTKVENFECKDCGKVFANYKVLKDHKTFHNGIKCNYCDKRFMKKEMLKFHRREMHEIKEKGEKKQKTSANAFVIPKK